MKKLLIFLSAAALTMTTFCSAALADETAPEPVKDPNASEDIMPSTDAPADPSAVTVYIDGVELEADVPAQIIGDRTMVPMRAIFETLGAQVTWIPEEQSIFATHGPTLIVMKIGVNTMAVASIGADNKSVELDVPPQIVNDRTLVPVRAISEALGCTVDWDDATRTVTIIR